MVNSLADRDNIQETHGGESNCQTLGQTPALFQILFESMSGNFQVPHVA